MGAPPGEFTVGWADDSYPSQLRHIVDPPPVLFVRGSLAGLASPCLAIVGSRDATAYGVGMARELGRGLAALGITVVSGLALGIDGAAHRGALEASGETVAVVGSGTDIVYPRQHRRLREEILATGAIVSEMPPSTAPLKQHFPRRNRLISGLCLGVIIVEATERSGSLITARHALAQGREVFAVPGPVTSPRSRGPHSLLRQGAALVETVDDVLAALPILAAGLSRLRDLDTPAGRTAEKLLELVAQGADTVDELAAQSERQVHEILSDLLTLELSGKLLRGTGGRLVAVGLNRDQKSSR